ncbi:MAG: GH3 family domain-containing protein, partial [Bacteroidota bacterium]
MGILGNIIKGALEITDKVIPEGSPVEQQQDQLKQLLQKASSTEFGRYYHFDDILNNKDPHKAFTEQVPYHDYDTINEHWWKKQREHGLSDVTWPGKTTYYALSAGTTGDESKRIPITEEMLESIRKTSRNQILSSSNFDFPAEFYQREILMLGSATRLDKVGNHYEGEISGIAAGNIPNWFERFYRPGKKIASITDWDKRVEAIAKEAKNWDIGAMAGMPSWNELMLKKIIDYNRVSHIHDIWPNLRVFVSGGVALDPYQKSFDK